MSISETTALILTLFSSAALAASGEVAEGKYAGQTMVFASSGGIMQEGQKKAIWDSFEVQSGAKVLQDAVDFNKIRAMVENEQVVWDVVIGNRYQIAEFCGTLFEKIDRNIVDISNVPDNTISSECMVPAYLYGDAIVYNTDLMKEAPTGWKDFFDVEKFPGKRGIYMGTGPAVGLVIAALLADGVAPADLYPIDFDRAFNKLKSLGDNAVPWTTGAQAQQQIESGEVAMSWMWLGRGYGAAKAGAPVEAVWNQWTVAVDGLAIPKGTKNLELANAAINYYLGPEQAARLTEATAYSPVNVKAQPKLDETASEWLITDEKRAHAIFPDVDYWVKNWSTLYDKWTAWVSGG